MFRIAGLVWILFALVSAAQEPKQGERPSKDDPSKKPQWQRTLTGDDLKKSKAWVQKIEELKEANETAQALKLAEELLTFRARLQGADHYQVRDAKSLTEELKRPALTAEQRERIKEAEGLNSKVFQLWQQGKSKEAIPLALKALEIRQELLGITHPDTCLSIFNLAAQYLATGEYQKAEPLYRDALRIRRESLGERHPDTAHSLNSLASLYSSQGRYAEAEPLYRDALRIRREAMGEKHPDTAGSLNNLASLYESQARYAEAEPLYRDALRIKKEALGENHPSTATSLNNLAGLYSSQARYAEAELLYRDALRIKREALGEKHPSTASSLNSLAGLYQSQGKYAEAEKLFRDALRIHREALGEKHPSTAASLHNLASLYSSQARYAEAEPLYRDALRIHREALGEKHPSTASSLNSLASLNQSQGKYAEAEPLYRDALRIRREAMGEKHPDTAGSLNNLANLYSSQARYAEAEGILRECANSFEASRLFGARSVERAVGNSKENPYPLLASVSAVRGKWAEAYRALELDAARGLFDEQAERRGTALSADEEAKRKELRARLGAVESRILDLVTRPERSEVEQKELDSLTAERRKLDDAAAALAADVSRREVTDLPTIQSALTKESALIAWVDVADNTEKVQEHWACVVRSAGEPKWQRLPGSGPDGKWAKADTALPSLLRAELANDTPDPAKIDALFARLRTQRIAPILKHLEGVRTLYVVPVHEMAGIPVEPMLPDLMIGYVPSGTWLARLKDEPKAAGIGLLALGDPIFDTGTPSEKDEPLPPGGLLVQQVAADGAAAKAGVRDGDVLVKYGDVELDSLDKLGEAIAANAAAKSIPVLVWRESRAEPFLLEVAPGRLGVSLAKEPALVAITNRRKTDAMLAKSRGRDWNDLPGTRLELVALRKLFGDRVTTLSDSDASEERLDALRRSGELAKFRYLHFATHGAGNSVRAFESALILAQDRLPKELLSKPGEPFLDGQLSAREVLDFWKLDAELVTLSACETAIGRTAGGDGLLGFAQAFLSAGSRSVCLSLWKVDDTATALLMERFYANLEAGRPKAAALSEAKSWLRNLTSEEALKVSASLSNGAVRGKGQKALKVVAPVVDPKADPKATKPFAHPRFWAAFVLIGDPN